jgi:phytoene dehydrogenase-like protein
MRNPLQADAIVAGGGLAGLAAATYLARAGRRVVVFEKARSTGGRARTRVTDGFSFNLGPHALYKGGEAAAVLRELNVSYTGKEPGASGGYGLHSGKLHTLPAGFVSLLSTGLLRPAEKLEFGRFLGGLARLETRNLRSIPLARWAERQFEHPRVAELILAYVRTATYADEPEESSAGCGLEQLQRGFKGVLYLDGGWQSLARELRNAAEGAGAEIVSGRTVASVIRDGASVRGVVLEDGAILRASSVLLAVGPGEAAGVVRGCRATILTEWASQAKPVYASSLDVALRRLPRPKTLVAIGIDRPLYFSVHSAVARLAPRDGATIHVMRYGGLRGMKAETVERELEGLLDQLQPGWRGELVTKRFLPNLTVSHALVTAAEGGTAGRPGPEVSGIEGLYVAGDWVGGEGMLTDAALASARRAASAILNARESIPEAVGVGQ